MSKTCEEPYAESERNPMYLKLRFCRRGLKTQVLSNNDHKEQESISYTC